ncbi:MAG: hypothetical protein AAB727_02750 [Patescibacteria group bacterium]
MNTKAKTYARLILFLIAALIVLGYAYGRTENLLRGPDISLVEPANGETVAEPLAEITGIIRNASFITLNGRQIYTDESGFFKEFVLLSYGYNVLLLEARDKFGRSTKKTIELVYK